MGHSIMDQHEDRNDELYLYARQLVERDTDFKHIREMLYERTGDRKLSDEIVDQVRDVYYAKKRKEGLAKLGIGCVLLVIGFVLTVINYHSNESFSLVMYGFTSGGLCLLFWGLYDMFG